MQGSLRVGRIRGIEIALHPSLLLAFVLIAWTLWSGWLPQMLPHRSDGVYLAVSIAGAIGLFVSVLLHELGHSFTAQARGVTVESITLFIFGGVASIAREPETPRDEFWITVFGPVTSFILAGISALVWYLARGSVAWLAALGAILGYLNFWLGLFNLVPGFPLDGGRILRSIVWGVTGNLLRATRVASLIGQVIGYGFIVWGIYRILVSQDFASGIWTAFIGWFLQNAAEGTYQQLRAEQMFRGVRVGQLMEPSPATIEPGATISRLIEEYLVARRMRAVPVVLGDRLLGIITVNDVQRVPRDEWPTTYVTQAMTRAESLQTVHPTDDLTVALNLLGRGQFHQLPVLDPAGQLVGLLSRADIIRYLQLHPAVARNGGKGPPTTPTTTA
ncbi:MAG TPA: site-2 protease family protein [Thermomicrobiales bacterium]|nr:site-2 protease family protein [Thermomicrobiales bacterium]